MAPTSKIINIKPTENITNTKAETFWLFEKQRNIMLMNSYVLICYVTLLTMFVNYCWRRRWWWSRRLWLCWRWQRQPWRCCWRRHILYGSIRFDTIWFISFYEFFLKMMPFECRPLLPLMNITHPWVPFY